MTPNKNVGSNWLHKKTGKMVVIIGHGKLEATNRPCFFYNEDGDQVIWARDQEEFLDGRFERVAYQVVVHSTDGIFVALVRADKHLSEIVKDYPTVTHVCDQEGTELWVKEQPVPQ